MVEEKREVFEEDDVGDEENRDEEDSEEERRADFEKYYIYDFDEEDPDEEDLSVPAPPRDSTDIAADGGEADNGTDIADSRDAAPAPPRGEHFDPDDTTGGADAPHAPHAQEMSKKKESFGRPSTKSSHRP